MAKTLPQEVLDYLSGKGKYAPEKNFQSAYLNGRLGAGKTSTLPTLDQLIEEALAYRPSPDFDSETDQDCALRVYRRLLGFHLGDEFHIAAQGTYTYDDQRTYHWAGMQLILGGETYGFMHNNLLFKLIYEHEYGDAERLWLVHDDEGVGYWFLEGHTDLIRPFVLQTLHAYIGHKQAAA